jgi:hypothetical protein
VQVDVVHDDVLVDGVDLRARGAVLASLPVLPVLSVAVVVVVAGLSRPYIPSAEDSVTATVL